MKSIIVAVLATALIGGIYSLSTKDFSTVYKAEVIEKVIDNTPEWAVDEDAVKAAQDVIRRKELEAELELLEAEVSERETRITEIEKEIGTY